MDNKAKNIPYTYADIEKYLQGNMSKDEMYAFELAAIQDEFLSDAIDGYKNENAATTQQNLKQIEQAIYGTTNEAKVIRLKKKQNIIYKYAAVAAVIAIAAVSVFLLTQNKNLPQNEVAQITSATTKLDSTAIASNPVTSSDTTATTQNNAPIVAALKNASIHNDSIAYAYNQTKQKTINTDADGVAEKLDLEPNKVISGGKSDEVTNALAITDYKATKETDDREKSVASNPTLAKDKKVVLPTIVMKPDTNFKAPLVASITRNRQAFVAKKATLTKEDSALVPQDGWASFNNYLQHNNTTNLMFDTTFSPTTITNRRSGEDVVDIEFEVGKNGMPQNFIITNNADSAVANKAINLLRNGPKWKADNKNNKAKVKLKL